MKNVLSFSIVILLILAFSLSVKGKGIKFGKFSKEEIEYEECPYEKDAAAVVLSKTCIVDLSYSMIRYFYHVRIKILKEEGLKYADIKLPFYRKDGIEKISGVKAQTINFDADGKKMESDLSGKNVFTVDVNENYGETRFGMPAVEVGSIIEYRYTMDSHFYSYLDTWYFQDEIPTLYSSLKVNMPESFRYDLVMFGDRLSAKYPVVESNEWILTNLQSIKDEPYVNNYVDFVEQIRFQLTGYYKKSTSISGGVEFVSAKSSWKDLANEYLESIDFLGRKGFAKKQLENILDGSENNWEKIEKIYDFVRTNVKWNEKYRLYPKKSPPKVMEEKIASNSEINFLLVLLLREAGIKCNPALSRTNDLGLLQKDYPLMSQFNQVLVCVELYNNKLFLNALSPYRPYNLLADEDLNYYAFVLEKGKPRWEKIVPFSKSRQQITLVYDFNNLNSPSCKLQIQESGYYASTSRRLMTVNGIESRLNDLVDPTIFEFNEDSTEITNELNVNKPLIVKSNIPLEYDWDESSEVIYVNPFPEVATRNPFLEETRQYRIDYNYQRYRSLMISVKIPDSYKIEEFPRSKTVKLPDGSGEFKFTSQILGGELKIRTVFEIKHPSYNKELYPNLRELYSQMAKLLNSQIVIKKVNSI